MTSLSSTGGDQGGLVDDLLIAYLYERLVFEITLLHQRQNTITPTTSTNRNDFFPMDLSSKFAYIAHYYQELTLKDTYRQAGQALHRLKLNSLSGVINYIVNYRHCYKVIPEHIANDIRLDEGDYDDDYDSTYSSSSDRLPECISVPVFELKDIVNTRRKFATMVPEPYRGEVEFLVGLLQRNGLVCSSGDEFIEMCRALWVDMSGRNTESDVLRAYINDIQRRREKMASSPDRQRQEQELIDAMKEMTHSDVVMISSSSKGINFSDYDLELLIINTKKPKNLPPVIKGLGYNVTQTNDIPEDLLDSITQAGYETIEATKRYFEGKSGTNPSSVCFLDPKSNLTCQVSFDHSAGRSVRKLLQAYADIDERVEPFIHIIQETLTRYGRTRETLSNLAVAIIAISYLQKEKILPNLLKHQGRRVDFDFYSGPVEGKLPLEEEMVRGIDSRAAVTVPGRSRSKKRKGDKNKKFKQSRASPNASQPQTTRTPGTPRSEEDLGFKRLTESFLHCRIVCYEYDEETAKTKSFDKSPVKKTPFRLIVDFFDYASKKFKDWDNLLLTPTEPLVMTTGAKDRDEFFAGLVVQNPFALDRNLATLTTGWRFRSISDIFQRISSVLSSLPKRAVDGELSEVGAEKAREEHLKQGERSMDQLMSCLNAHDEYGDSVAGPSIEELAKGILLAYAYRLTPDGQ